MVQRPLTYAETFTERTAYKIGTGSFAKNADKNPIQLELVEEVEKIKKQLPGSVILQGPNGGVKSFESASRKAGDKLGDDWNKFNDLNRVTLVVPTKVMMSDALTRLIAHFSMARSSSSLKFRESKPIKAETDDCGYSHECITVETADHQRAEVQLNYPDMMFAKGGEGLWADKVREMVNKYAPVEGGLGHQIYEVFRVDKLSERGKNLAAAAKLYYKHFRSDTLDPTMPDQIRAALRKAEFPVAW